MAKAQLQVDMVAGGEDQLTPEMLVGLTMTIVYIIAGLFAQRYEAQLQLKKLKKH